MTAVNEVQVLEKKLAEARERAKPKTLAEKLREARGRCISSQHLANHLVIVIANYEANIAAHAEAVKARHAIGFPPPPPLKPIDFFSTDDVCQGNTVATKRMTPQEALEDARSQLARANSENAAAKREVVALEAELASNPIYKKAKAALDNLREEFISVAESGDALTSESVRQNLHGIADRERTLYDRLRGELFEKGLPDIKYRLFSEFWNFVPSEQLQAEVKQFFSQRNAALERLKNKD